jgi:rhodanese-related sulfurtransferase
MREMTREEIRRRRSDRGLTVLNVLPASAFAQAHIPGSLSLPLEDIPLRVPEVLPDRAAEIVVHCGGPD